MTYKILVHSNYAPDNHGGIEYVVSQLLKVCDASGYAIKCFYGGNQNFARIDANGVFHVQRKIIAKIRGLCLLSKGNINFFKLACDSDVVVYQEPYPFLWPSILLLRKLKRCKIILLVHADPVGSRFVRSIYSLIRSYIFRNVCVVATSPQLLRQVRITSEHSFVIPIGIESDYQFATAVSLHIKSQDPYVLYFGRLANYKGIEFLLDAALLLPHINFLIAGNGPLSESINNFMRAHGLDNVKFINKGVSDDEKVELIRRCTFLVFPSTTQNEAFGIVQLEAMRESKAIVNTYLNNGVNYVAPHNICAVTCKPNDANSLADAIDLMWRDDCLRKQLSERSRTRFLERFTSTQFFESWRNLFSMIVDER